MKWGTKQRIGRAFPRMAMGSGAHRMAEGLEQRTMLSVPAAPLQSVQTSVDASGVHFSVMDPQKNSPQTGFERLLAGETASTVLNSNGVIAWSKSWTDSFAALHTEVFWEVYDIQKGAWQGGHQELAPGATLGALQNSGGVVSWSATNLDYYSAPNARVFYEVYDPQKGAWRDGDTTLAAGEIVSTVQDSGGVIAFSASSRDLYSDLHQRVFYRVYDPQRGAWRNGETDLARNETTTTITITNCTVSWTSNVATYTRGYDPGSGKWTAHASKPLAFFYGGSYIGSHPLTLYLWDMSIGATSWSWAFGDASDSGDQAPTHTYTTADVFTLVQTATNAGVSSTQQVTVTTNAVAPMGIALSNNNVAEHMPRGTVVGTLGAVGLGKFTWSLVGGDGSQDNASFRISGSQLTTAAVFDYTKKNTYSIRVRVTDKGGLNSESVFTINVLNMFDMSGTSLAVTPGSLTELGGVISVKRTYQITDRPAVPDFAIQYHLSTDQVWGNPDDIILGGDESISTNGGKSVGTHAKTVKLNVGHVMVNPNGTYFLLANLDAANTVSENNETNNVTSAPVQIALPSFGWVNGVHQAMKVPDTDGDLLKFSLTGTGIGQLTGANLDVLTLTGTNASSVLKITVIKSGGGDGLFQLSGLSSDALLKRVDAGAVVLSGLVQINTLNRTAAKASISLKFRQIHDANIQVQGLPIASIAVGGTVSASKIVATGSIEEFSAVALSDSDILVGVVTSFAGKFAQSAGDFTNTSAKLGSLTVTGQKLPKGSSYPAYVSAVHVSAPSIGTLKLANVSNAAGALQANVLKDTGTLTITALNPLTTGVSVLPAGTWEPGTADRPDVFTVV